MRLIEADALNTFLKEHWQWLDDGEYADGFHDVIELLEKVPTIEAEPVRHGRWIEQEAPNMDTYYDCSVCGESFCLIEGSPMDNLYIYCPNCGAKMDKENEE